MTAARLRQPTAHHVPDAQDHDVEPCLIGGKVVGVPVGRFHEERGEQDTDGCDDEDDELGRLVERLGLIAAYRTSDPVEVCCATGGMRYVLATDRGGIVGRGHGYSLHTQPKSLSTAWIACATSERR